MVCHQRQSRLVFILLILLLIFLPVLTLLINAFKCFLYAGFGSDDGDLSSLQSNGKVIA